MTLVTKRGYLKIVTETVTWLLRARESADNWKEDSIAEEDYINWRASCVKL